MNWLGPILLMIVVALSWALPTYPGEMLVRNTVRLALGWYLLSLLLMLGMSRLEWFEMRSRRGKMTRWAWTWSSVTFLVHLAMAFHFYHNWSHDSAFERTRAVSGYGEGVYVSYLFTLLWCADVLWWWLDERGYAARPEVVGRVLHAFMLFIVFNGTVIYEAGPIRWAGVAGFALLASAWVVRRLKDTGLETADTVR